MQSRSKYIKQLDDLEAHVQRLGDHVVADIRAAGLALAGDEGSAEGVLQGRKAERRLQHAIESGCLDALLLQQPLVAGDLRFVSGVFRIVSDLSHIGSMTRDIAFLSQSVPGEIVARVGDNLAASCEKAADMVALAVSAFKDADEEAARRVFALDNEVDELYKRSQDVIVEMIRTTTSDPEHLPELLMVAKYFERIGDDAQRIAGWALFRVTGHHEVYYKAHDGEGANEAFPS